MSETAECQASSEKVDFEQLFGEAQSLVEKLDMLYSQHNDWQQLTTDYKKLRKGVLGIGEVGASKQSEFEKPKDD